MFQYFPEEGFEMNRCESLFVFHITLLPILHVYEKLSFRFLKKNKISRHFPASNNQSQQVFSPVEMYSELCLRVFSLKSELCQVKQATTANGQRETRFFHLL